MKKLFFILLLSFSAMLVNAQTETTTTSAQDTTIVYRILKTDGGELIGRIISQDEREVLLLTEDNRRIYIPQHSIKEIVALNANEMNKNGEFIGEDRFSTRYFLTTNALPLKKGDHYVQWNLFGPNFQFAVGKDLGVGIMTSWFGVPIIGTIKKSWELGEKSQLALGGLFGTGSWATPDFGGALPFATISFGDRNKNIAFSGGYGVTFGDGEANGSALAGIAGMARISKKLSLVLDSFFLLPKANEPTLINGLEISNERPLFGLIIPGLRWHQGEGKAFQFGFAAVLSGDDLVPFPVPMVQWYRAL